MRFFALLVLTFGLGRASATEFFYQPPLGAHAVSLQGGYRDGDRRLTGQGLHNSISGLNRLGVNYAYGFSEGLSLGASLAYSDFDLGGSAKGESLGFDPLLIDLRGRLSLSAFEVLYGAEIRTALEKPQSKSNGTQTRTFGDFAEGYNNGFVLTLKFGSTTESGPHHGGFLFTQDIYRRDTSESFWEGEKEGTLKIKVKDGMRTNLIAFYEWQAPLYIVGVDLGWTKQWEMTTTNGTNTGTRPGYGLAHADVYANVAVSSVISVLPTVTWITRALSADKEPYEDFRAMLALRYTL